MSTSWPVSPNQGQPSVQTMRFSIAPTSPKSSVGVDSPAGSDIPHAGQSVASQSQAQPGRAGLQRPGAALAGSGSSTLTPSVLGPAVLQRMSPVSSLAKLAPSGPPTPASAAPISAPPSLPPLAAFGVTSAAWTSPVPAPVAGHAAPCNLTQPSAASTAPVPAPVAGQAPARSLTQSSLSRRRAASASSSQSSQTGASPKSSHDLSRRAFIQPGRQEDLAEMDELFFSMTEEEFIECMGLGALSILARDAKDVFGLVCIAAQAFALQFAVLYGMWLCTHREDACHFDVAGRLPLSLICAAIYLHFMNVFVDIPFALCLIMNFRHLRPGLKEACMAMPIFLADALLVPAATMVVGALFLCTSMTIQDVFLNSVACTFVSGVDNWILNLSMKLKRMAGEKRSGTVHIPYQKNVITVLDNAVCVFPVVPLVFTGATAYLGLEIMGMPCPGGWEAD